MGTQGGGGSPSPETRRGAYSQAGGGAEKFGGGGPGCGDICLGPPGGTRAALPAALPARLWGGGGGPGLGVRPSINVCQGDHPPPSPPPGRPAAGLGRKGSQGWGGGRFWGVTRVLGGGAHAPLGSVWLRGDGRRGWGRCFFLGGGSREGCGERGAVGGGGLSLGSVVPGEPRLVGKPGWGGPWGGGGGGVPRERSPCDGEGVPKGKIFRIWGISRWGGGYDGEGLSRGGGVVPGFLGGYRGGGGGLPRVPQHRRQVALQDRECAVRVGAGHPGWGGAKSGEGRDPRTI